MTQYFIAHISRPKQLDNGAIKQVKEQFLLDALTYTEAEACITKEMQTIAPDFDILSVKKARLDEVLCRPNSSWTTWYRVKINYLVVDERTGIEKKSPSSMLVEALDFERAYQTLLNHMANSIMNWEIASISETPIVDYYPYSSD